MLAPLIERQAAAAKGAFGRWQRGDLDLRNVRHQDGLAAPDLFDDHLDLLYEVWGAHEKSGPFLVSSCRKGYPTVGLAHALGPRRFAALPGWFGNFVLDPEQVRATLPGVEAAFALDPAQQAIAEQRLHEVLEEVTAEDAAVLFDEVVPTWRRAADLDWGLIGAQATPT
ncbi:hypothetical protein [Streptomyces sp. TLI_171]|uniref:hypothetical protein n=1 Tax=Streptomyces sp. TLI_171 TaxID=1938859 RepID=UPI000C18C641|nr:hypothetical protein [Streptomyces sp. TLI_171]RKE05124.1 hypothetical protein BX266_7387 [Streptomyces sp. TLI_171]